MNTLRYFDSSALVKRYVEEEASASVRRLLAHEPRATLRLSQAEVASALARRCREGAFSQAELWGALRALEHDLHGLLVAELTEDVVSGAIDLVQRHPLRAGDALQLGAAIALGRRLGVPVLFVAFDQRLLAAAKKERLKTAPE